jgi:hypothetical protein
MNRVTRISSAAFGMLLLLGLAYYQVLPDPTRSQDGALVGTAMTKNPKAAEDKCDDAASLNEEEARLCAKKKNAENSN